MAYVYAHIRQDTLSVFYIGIGYSKKDKNFDRAYSKDPRNPYRSNIVNKTDYTVIILHKDLTVEEAKAKEIELIAMYGRKDLGTGCLVNMTKGGDGVVDAIRSDEWRLNHSNMLKGRSNGPLSDETKFKISESKKGITAWNKGLSPSEETKAIMSINNKGEKNPMFGKSSWPVCPVLQHFRKEKQKAKLASTIANKKAAKKDDNTTI